MPRWVLFLSLLTGATILSAAAVSKEPMPMEVPLRKQVKEEIEGKVRWVVMEENVHWIPRETAIIVCDMWDQHWCPNAAQRVEELAKPMNSVLKEARALGMFIIHAPSTATKFYDGTPQRERAKAAPYVKTPVPLATDQRWGTAWCYPDKQREAELPIDDSDMGCDCEEKYEPHAPWTRQIATLEIAEQDAITDDGQETWNLLEERGIKNVILLGVHLNMCVMGRPFGIRQMTYLGKNVVLMRDMTDTMYNPAKAPFVNHYKGTELIIEHIEKFVCPTITSDQIIGGKAFRFKADPN